MKNSSNTSDQQLEKLYDLRDALINDVNKINQRGLTLYRQIQELKGKISSGTSSKLEECKEELAKVQNRLDETKIEDRLAAVRERIAARETELYGKPLSDSPHPRKK